MFPEQRSSGRWHGRDFSCSWLTVEVGLFNWTSSPNLESHPAGSGKLHCSELSGLRAEALEDLRRPLDLGCSKPEARDF